MQGNLNEIDIRSILQLIELGQRTGELFVEAYGSYHLQFKSDRGSKSLKQQSWFVFFLNGQIIYAGDGDSSLSRLRDYLQRYRLDTHLDEVKISSLAANNAPEYGYLWALLEKHVINPTEARSIIYSMVQETLFDLLSLCQGSFIFELSPALSPQLTTLEINPLVTKIMKQVQEWKQLHPHIQSPNQCLLLGDMVHLRASLPATTLQRLEHWADGKTSLRQLARYFNRDILTVARAIYPYVQQGSVQLVYPVTSRTGTHKRDWRLWSQTTKMKRIVCIDDGITTCKTVESILQQQGYEAIGITNPLEALSRVFKIKPDLILCDIAMPELDGYEICAMLRHSTAFRLVPIVMLTGKDGFIDRVKARMVGATDYLTKPFGDSELLMLVEKYLNPRQMMARKYSENSLVVPIQDEIKINITEARDTDTSQGRELVND
ncbi:MAG: response regulator [Nostocaceae cyanobacterium]|nr:response regulator [Nostocaceae cyanobacterium]